VPTRSKHVDFPTHGNYLPPEVRWEGLGDDRHVVYLYKLKPGHVRRTKIRIGELRRSPRPGFKGERCWRAFPEKMNEFPEVCDNHIQALEYLVTRWEAAPVIIESAKPRQPRKYPEPPTEPVAWPMFFGPDPFA
jgi:hypothetical protein